MRKSRLIDGTPICVFKIEHFVRLGVFATALTDYFYRRNEDFNAKIKKSEAVKILKLELFHYGNRGEFHDGFFESTTDVGEEYNAVYSQAEKWIILNYPYLKG